MNLLDRFRYLSIELSEEEAERLAVSRFHGHTIRAQPPANKNLPATLDGFVKAVMEPQTKWFGLRNTSPVSAFEIRRTTPESLTFQYSVPTKRLDRKVRTHLPNQVENVRLEEGETGLPVQEGVEVGGGLLTTGRQDWFPLQMDFDSPPINSIAAALHHHALPQTKFVIQVLYKPAAGHPLRRRYRNIRTYQQIGHLRREKEQLWGGRSPTPREKNQANKIEDKAGTFQFHTSIRLLFTNPGEYTRSRVKELAGAFNVFENTETGQYLDTVTVTPYRRKSLFRFLQAVADRRFDGWSRSFRTSIPELAGLITLPSRRQENIRDAQP